MEEDAREPVIRLDESGIGLLREWASPCTEFRVLRKPDSSIVLYPMSAPEAELWRSGLVREIAEAFSRPDRMLRMKVGSL